MKAISEFRIRTREAGMIKSFRDARSAGFIAIAMLVAGVPLLATGCCFTNSLACSFPILYPWMHQEVERPVEFQPTLSAFVSPALRTSRPRRVVMLEAGPSPGNYGQSKRMINELTSQIRSAGLFEVIAPAHTPIKSQMDAVLQGKFNERELVEISRQYNADAVAFVRVNELRGFAPMRTSVTMAIVDSRESIVLYAVDGNWDTANRHTQNEFTAHVTSLGDSIPGPANVQLQSPRALMSFAASQIADNISSAVR